MHYTGRMGHRPLRHGFRPRLTVGIAIGLGGIIGALGLPPSAGAQEPSLAELAARERARRAAITDPARVYTNADLASTPRLTILRSGADASEPIASLDEVHDGDPALGGDARRPDGTDEEPAAEKRLADAREQRRRSALHAAAIQNRIDGLWAAFTARDDPAQRAQLERERTEALAELEQLRSELASLDETVLTLEEETRRQR